MTLTDGRAETEAAMHPLPRGVDWEDLVAQSGWVRAVAQNLVRDSSRADDVAQETLLAALANPPHDAADSRRLRAWLARVAFNLSRLGSRQLARRTAREQRVARHEAVPSVSDELEAAGTLSALGDALAALPAAYRDAIEMRYFDGLSTADIAARTGVTELAVRKRLWRARLRLRDALDREVGGGARILAALFPWRLLRAPASPGRLLALGSGVAAGLLLTVALAPWAPGDRRDAPHTADVAALAAPGTRVAALGSTHGSATTDPDAGEPARPSAEPLRRPVPPPTEPEPKPEKSEARAPRAAFHAGMVLDLEGAPRGGVALVASLDEGAPELARTDASGAFRVRDEGVDLAVAARAPGLATVVRARFDARFPGEPEVVVVAPASDLAGSVVDEDGRPVAGARLELRCRASAFARVGWAVELDSPVLQALVADGRGAFALRALPRGTDLYLEVESAGYAPLVVETPSLGTEARLVLRALPPPTLVAGTVVHRDGRPAAGAVVRLGTERATADARGRWRLTVTDDVGADAPLEARDDTAAPALVHRFGALLARGALEGEVELQLGEEYDAVEGALEGDTPGGWRIAAFAAGAPADGEPVATTTSDGRGAFTLRLPRGEYAVHALAPGELRVASRSDLDTRAGLWELAVPPRAALATVAGAFHADDGRALALADVEVRVRLGEQLLAWAELATDAHGAFQFPAQPGLALELAPHHPATASRAFGLTAGAGSEPYALVAARRAFVQVAGADAERCTLLDADGRALVVRDPLGETRALALRDGFGPAVEVPAEARWLELSSADAAPRLVPLDPAPGELLRVRP